MTLILTSLSPQWVVQASDTRISDARGPRHDRAHKSIPFLAGNGHGHLVVSYYGLAEIQDRTPHRRTLDEWLSEAIARAAASSRRLEDILTAVMADLDEAVNATVAALPASDPRMTILITGYLYSDPMPWILCISNFADCGSSLVARKEGLQLQKIFGKARHAEGKFELFELQTKGKFAIAVHGDTRGISTNNISELAQRVDAAVTENQPEVALDAMRDAIRAASMTLPRGTVSTDCWSQIIKRGCWAAEVGRPIDDPDEQFTMPQAILGGSRITAIIVQDVPGTHKAAERLAAGLTTDPFDAPTILAYLEWSPTLRRLSAIAEKLGLVVEPQLYAPDVLMMVELSGRRSAFTLEKHLEESSIWADALIADFVGGMTRAGAARVTIERDVILAAILVGLRPSAYPTERYGAFRWPISDNLVRLALKHNPPKA